MPFFEKKTIEFFKFLVNINFFFCVNILARFISGDIYDWYISWIFNFFFKSLL